jgi:HD-GYP domain-containing protein (c-di-GMP phosphodiesterase class II)
MPRGLRGDAIPVVSRVAYASTYFEVFGDTVGRNAAEQVGQARREGAFDPAVVDAFLRVSRRPGFWTPLEGESILDVVLALKPGPPAAAAGEPALEALALTFADFVDLKSHFFAGHSRRVASLAESMGQRLRLPTSELGALRRAALMHDVGFVAVPSYLINKAPDERSRSEQEAIDGHPEQAEKVLQPIRALAAERAIVGAHHERPDGGGSRGLPWADVPNGARIIAVADRFDELTHDQPGSPGLGPEAAVDRLRQEAGTGLDPDVVRLLEEEVGAPRRPSPARTSRPAGLTEREVEVLQLLGRGLKRQEVARALVVSDATARHHLEHIYDKIGTSTRVGAVLFAMEHGLLE